MLTSFLCFCFFNITYTDNNESNIIKEIENQIISDKPIQVTTDILGYIEIPKYNIKKVIKNNSLQSTLDAGYVGLFLTSDLNQNIIIIAGHNNKSIFKPLHYSKLGEEIFITSYNKKEVYKIVKKREVLETDFSYFESEYDKKTLILITCTTTKNKRLLVFAEKD